MSKKKTNNKGQDLLRDALNDADLEDCKQFIEKVNSDPSLTFRQKKRKFQRRIAENDGFGENSDLSRAGIRSDLPSVSDLFYRILTTDVDQSYFNSSSYVNLKTDQLITHCSDMQQFSGIQFSDFQDLVDAAQSNEEVDDSVKTALKEIASKRQDIRENHYALIALLLNGHVDLDLLFEKYSMHEFLELKNAVESCLLKYNAHNPYLCFKTEEQQLRFLRTQIEAITVNVKKVLMSREFYNANNAYLENNKSVNQTQSEPADGKKSTDEKQIVDSQLQGTINLINSLVDTPGNGKKDGKSVLVTKAHEVIIDIQDTSNAMDVFTKINSLAKNIISESLVIIREAKKIGSDIDYNVYTNQFGVAVDSESNASKMDQARISVLKYIQNKAQLSSTLVPKFFIKEQMSYNVFPGNEIPGKVAYSTALTPGEKREVRLQTTETTRETRNNSKSILDSTTETVQDDLENELEKETNRSRSDSEELSNYFDESKEDNISFDMEVTAKAEIKKIVEVGTTLNRDHEVNTETQQGYQAQTNTDREKAVRNLERSLDKHLNNTTSKKETNIMESVETSTELMKSESQAILVANPNEGSSIVMDFRSIDRLYLTVVSLSDIFLVFSNGRDKITYTLPQLQTAVSNHFKPEYQDVVLDRFLFMLKCQLTVEDYKHRTFTMYEYDERLKMLKYNSEVYFDILEEENAMVDDDDRIAIFKRNIPGVVLSVKNRIQPASGVIPFIKASESGLDEYNSQMMEQRIEKTKIELERQNILNKSVEIDNETKLLLNDHVKSIKEGSEAEKLKTKTLLYSKDSESVLNNVFLGQFVDDKLDKRKVVFKKANRE